MWTFHFFIYCLVQSTRLSRIIVDTIKRGTELPVSGVPKIDILQIRLVFLFIYIHKLNCLAQQAGQMKLIR